MRVKVTKEKIDDIADAIREGLGTSDTMTLSEMPEKIGELVGFDFSAITATADDVLIGNTLVDSTGSLVNGTNTGTSSEIPMAVSFEVESSTRHDKYCSAYGNNIFLMARNNNIIRSNDGINWDTINLPQSSTTEPLLAYGNGIFLLVLFSSNYNRVYTSYDGITWNHANDFIGGDSNDNRSLCFGQNSFLLTVDDDIYSSIDGLSWTNIATIPIGAAGYKLCCIHTVYIDGIFFTSYTYEVRDEEEMTVSIRANYNMSSSGWSGSMKVPEGAQYIFNFIGKLTSDDMGNMYVVNDWWGDEQYEIYKYSKKNYYRSQNIKPLNDFERSSDSVVPISNAYYAIGFNNGVGIVMNEKSTTGYFSIGGGAFEEFTVPYINSGSSTPINCISGDGKIIFIGSDSGVCFYI